MVLRKENKPVIIILIMFLIALFFVAQVPSLQFAVLFYGLLAVSSIAIYSLPLFQSYLIGIPKKGLLLSILSGLFVGGIVFILPKFGLSIGIPLVPASAEGSLRWVIVNLFAPFLEEIATRGALLGLILYSVAKGKKLSKTVLWIAIIGQALLFTGIHFTAYSQGWYSAPDLSASIFQIGAVSASLISAFIFAVLMGFFVTRSKINSLAFSISAHYIINQLLFVKLSAVII